MAVEELVVKHKLQPADLTSRVTPVDDIFVLAHMGVPVTNKEDWSLQIDGLVEFPVKLTFAELLKRPKRVIEAVHHCAGRPSDPASPSRQVANVRWGGVDLGRLLQEVRVQPEASHVWGYGIDHGEFAGEKADCYLKDLPLDRVRSGDVLVAFEMNDKPLTAEHGFPVRLVVPGFYGTNSVKWLNRISLSDGRSDGPFTTTFYNDPVRNSDGRRPVWETPPGSVIVSPSKDAELQAGDVEVWGWAWSAEEIESVEISLDGCHTWQEAHVVPRFQRSWQRFHWIWSGCQPGSYEISCKATDSLGQTQPLEGARNAVFSAPVVVQE